MCFSFHEFNEVRSFYNFYIGGLALTRARRLFLVVSEYGYISTVLSFICSNRHISAKIENSTVGKKEFYEHNYT